MAGSPGHHSRPTLLQRTESKRNSNKKSRKCVDGGIGKNNLARIALSEFRARYHDPSHNHPPALLLSVGTGLRVGASQTDLGAVEPHKPFRKRVFGKLYFLRDAFKIVRDEATDCEEVLRELYELAEGLRAWYKRLNVDTGVGDIGLAEWESSSEDCGEGRKRKI